MFSVWAPNQVFEAALEMASKGLYVFPCRGKKPRTSHGFHDASVESADLEAWWSKHPDASIGIDCGRSNLVVIDLDQTDKADGVDSLRGILEQEGFAWPETLIARTPSGGTHNYFVHDHSRLSLGISASMIAPGIDVRGDGGYAIAPPSRTEAGCYSWIDPTMEPMPLPEWLIGRIQRAKAGRAPSSNAAARKGRKATKAECTAAAALLRTQVRTIRNTQEGQRNDQLNTSSFLVGMQVANNRINRKEAERMLIAAGVEAGLPPREAEATVNSGLEAGILKASEPEFPMTDLGNAARLVAGFGDRIRYCKALGGWLHHDGTTWTQNGEAPVRELAKSVILGICEEAARDNDDRLAKWGRTSQSRAHFDGMLIPAWSDPKVHCPDPSAFDSNPYMLNCANGTLDLETGILRPHSPEDMMIRIAPVSFDPAATCPLWEKFLAEVLPESTIRFLKRAVGYSLSGDTSEQSLLFLYGSGANGKSVFIDTVSAVLGGYAINTRPETFYEKRPDAISNDVARLKGARFVSACETSSRRLDEPLIKSLTGGDLITARFLHQEYFQFRPTAKLWIHGNERPRVSGTDHGLWRRLLVVNFGVQIPPERQDKHLAVILRSELPGILNWALAGFADWRANGLGVPKEVVAATTSYRIQMDLIQQFIDECCAMEAGGRTQSATLFEAYVEFCITRGETAGSMRSFSEALERKGFVKSKNGKIFWNGISLNP